MILLCSSPTNYEQTEVLPQVSVQADNFAEQGGGAPLPDYRGVCPGVPTRSYATAERHRVSNSRELALRST